VGRSGEGVLALGARGGCPECPSTPTASPPLGLRGSGPTVREGPPSNLRLKLSALLLKEALCRLMFSTSAAA
jgi:hypothetical protein